MAFTPHASRRSTAIMSRRFHTGGMTMRKSALIVHNRCRANSLLWRRDSHPQRFSSLSFSSSSSLLDESTAHSGTTTTITSKQQEDQQQQQELYQELQSLSSVIRHHDTLYYSHNSPILSDPQYDALTDREAYICTHHPHLLERLQSETGLGIRATRFGGRIGPVLHDDPTATMSPPLPGVEPNKPTTRHVKLRHIETQPMQSLDNAMTETDLLAWLNRISKLLQTTTTTTEAGDENRTLELLTEPKMDGLSLSLRYQLVSQTSKDTSPFEYNNNHSDNNNNSTHNNNVAEYRFQWGATRGDGTSGENVTDAVLAMMTMKRRPPTIQTNDDTRDVEEEGSVPFSFRHTFHTTTTVLPDCIEIRGEVLLPISSFQTLHETIPTTSTGTKKDSSKRPQFSNARNAAAGILLRFKDDETERTTLDAVTNTKLLQSYLRFYAYGIATTTTTASITNDDDEDVWYRNGLELRSFLESWGFTVPNPTTLVSIPLLPSEQQLTIMDCRPLLRYHESIGNARSLDFEIDGAVYKLNSILHRTTAGSSNRAPRWAIAHKFPPKCAITKIQDVIVQVGRTGALTPVAILDPVHLGSVRIGRATLHNFHQAQHILEATPPSTTQSGDEDDDDLVVPIGVSVMISRAGDVIPQVLRRVHPADENCPMVVPANDDDTTDIGLRGGFLSLKVPKTCPACGSITFFDSVTSREQQQKSTIKNGTNDAIIDDDDEKALNDESSASFITTTGQVLRCGGPQYSCPPRAIGALSHAYSRPGLDVAGLSDARIQQLMNANLIKFPCDLFRIVTNDSTLVEEKIACLPGWGTKSATNLVRSIRSVAAEGVSLSRFIYSLGIRHVGSHSSKLIASSYGTVSAFLDALDHASKRHDPTTAEEVDSSSIPTAPPCFGELITTDHKDTIGNNHNLKGIGPVLIESLLAFSKERELVKATKDLANHIPVHYDDTVKSTSPKSAYSSLMVLSNNDDALPFEGMTVVFAGGKIPNVSRSAAQALAREMGAKSTPTTISKSTSLVVQGDDGGGSNRKKVQEARKLGIRIMTCEEFLLLVEQSKKK